MASDSLYPIGAVSRLTGITVDTLRIWERRYGVVKPGRDDRGRLYSEGDVRHLQLLAAAVARGHSIGRLAKLSEVGLQDLLSAAPVAADAARTATGAAGAGTTGLLLTAIQQYDPIALDRELGRLSLAMLPRELVHRVVLPVMKHVGDEWEAGRLTASQEHLLSAALRNLLGAMVRQSAGERSARRVLFATPAGDRHEFGILAAAMLTALGGLGVVYLGPDLPGAQIVEAAGHSGAQVVVIGSVYVTGAPQTHDEVRYIAEHLPTATELWLGGPVFTATPRPVSRSHVAVLPDLAAFETELARLGAR